MDDAGELGINMVSTHTLRSYDAVPYKEKIDHINELSDAYASEHFNPRNLKLFADGVTEATDANNELYGEERLINRLNSMDIVDMESVCKQVKEDVDLFVGEAPQFDDITMVALEFKKRMGE